jgi:hypothetical protein
MKTFIVGSLAAASLVAGALISPSQAQTQTDQQQNQPGTGGASKPGVQGLPGSKSGPTVKSTDPTATQRAANPGAGAGSNDQTSTPTKNQDESKVPGLPGSKAGPATKKE